MIHDKCVHCGTESVKESDKLGQPCDGCGRWLCPSCFSQIEPVYTGNVTQFGMVGYLKLCKDCMEKYHPIKITEHPYIG